MTDTIELNEKLDLEHTLMRHALARGLDSVNLLKEQPRWADVNYHYTLTEIGKQAIKNGKSNLYD